MAIDANPAMDNRFITIEPILDFDLDEFKRLISSAAPSYVNIGADSGNNHLPEPPPEKIRGLIAGLKMFTGVRLKKNLKRYCRRRAGDRGAQG